MEYKDEFPNSKIVGDPTPGTLNIFRYGAKTAAKLRFYDRNPLCYIMSTQGGIFFGVNLHYHPTTNRMSLLKYIDDGGDPSSLRQMEVWAVDKPATVPSHACGSFLANSLVTMIEAQEGLQRQEKSNMIL